MTFSVLDWTFGIGISAAVIFAGAGGWIEFGHPSESFEKVCNKFSKKRENLAGFSKQELKTHCECIKEELQNDHADVVNYTYLIKWMTLDNPDDIYKLDEGFSQQSIDLFNTAYQQCVSPNDGSDR